MTAPAQCQARPPGRAWPAHPVDLRRKPRRFESVIKAVLLGSALLSVLITFGIILALIEPVIHFFGQVSARGVLRHRGPATP